MTTLLQQAYTSLNDNRLQEASDTARALLDHDPQDYRNWALLREINARANRHQQAIYAANRVVALKPEDADALLGLSRVLINAGSQSEALTTLASIKAEAITEQIRATKNKLKEKQRWGTH